MYKLLVLLFVLIGQAAVHAADNTLYAGAGITRAEFYKFLEDLDDAPGISIDRTDTGLQVFGGYTLNRFVAVELGYTDGFTFRRDLEYDFGSEHSEVDASAFSFLIVGRIPVTQRIGILGKAGFGLWKLEMESTLHSPSGTTLAFQAQSGNGAAYGVGISANASDELELRGEYQVIEILRDVELRTMSLAASWKF